MSSVSATSAREPAGPPHNSNSTVVTNLNDSGPGSLREAIAQANRDGVPSVIKFASTLSGGTIQLQSGLPPLQEDSTTLNGDINGDGRPDIELDGQLLEWANGIQVASSHNLIRGLAIGRFPGNGVEITGNDNRVEYCYIGTDLTGTQDRGNTNSGVMVTGEKGGAAGATGNQIGPGNVIAYNVMYPSPNGGVAVLDGANWAYPEFAGLSPDYTGIFGVLDFPHTNGAFTSADGITPIDHNGHPFADTFGARFSGKLTVSTAGSYTFSIIQPDDNVRVVVDGVVIVEGHCCEQRIEGVGSLDASEHAFEVDYFDGGGAAGFAVEIAGPGPTNFSTNGQSGLLGEFFQLRIPTERNRITQNSIFDNGRIGIELDALEDWYGVNINDPGDGDVGPNTALNYPVLTSAHATPGRLIVKGTIDTPNQRSITIEFFANPVPIPGGDPSGHGEGAIYLGSVRPNPRGKFTTPLPPVPAGTLISATATDADGNTSEFSKNIEATMPPQPSGGVLYVDVNARPGGNGSRVRPFKTIQAAIDAAQPNNTIKVAVGTYDENLVISGKTLTIQGGYDSKNWRATGKVEDTVIDGGGRGRTILIIDGAQVTLEGFTVTKGNNPCHDMGGGGGILVFGPTTEATIQRIIIRNNIATPPCGGGGIETGNGATASVINSIIANNSANDGGGICVWTDSQVLLLNTTVANNWPDGIGNWPAFNAHAAVWNTISWGNNGGPDVYGTDEVYYSLIGVDPLFVDAVHGNYHLRPGSPAIDAGTSVGAPSTDIDGDPRPMGAGVDIGADEFRPGRF